MQGKGFTPNVGPGLQSRPDPPALKCRLHITAVPLHTTATLAPIHGSARPTLLKCPFNTLTQWMWGGA
jgi:hypothetical protein